jgi:hypothetical protein
MPSGIIVEHLVDSGVIEADDSVRDGWVSGMMKKDFDVFKIGWRVMISFNGSELEIEGASPELYSELQAETGVDYEVYIAEFGDDPRLTKKSYSFKMSINIDFTPK